LIAQTRGVKNWIRFLYNGRRAAPKLYEKFDINGECFIVVSAKWNGMQTTMEYRMMRYKDWMQELRIS
jgi:hypothetical protein